MRRIGTSGFMMRSSSKALRLSAVVLGVGLLMAAGAARAGDDDEDDDKTFEEKVIEGIMKGMGATNMENSSIDYRERSPLVVPPKLDLPPPASAAAEKTAPNWPKDPDEARRKAAIAARKKEGTKDPRKARTCPDAVRTRGGQDHADRAHRTTNPIQPGDDEQSGAQPIPTRLYGGFGNIFGGNKTETAPFKGEPTRDSLTQPPPGYQTPSSSFAYGTGPKESLNKEYNPAQGKYGE